MLFLFFICFMLSWMMLAFGIVMVYEDVVNNYKYAKYDFDEDQRDNLPIEWEYESNKQF